MCQFGTTCKRAEVKDLAILKAQSSQLVARRERADASEREAPLKVQNFQAGARRERADVNELVAILQSKIKQCGTLFKRADANKPGAPPQIKT